MDGFHRMVVRHAFSRFNFIRETPPYYKNVANPINS